MLSQGPRRGVKRASTLALVQDPNDRSSGPPRAPSHPASASGTSVASPLVAVTSPRAEEQLPQQSTSADLSAVLLAFQRDAQIDEMKCLRRLREELPALAAAHLGARVSLRDAARILTLLQNLAAGDWSPDAPLVFAGVELLYVRQLLLCMIEPAYEELGSLLLDTLHVLLALLQLRDVRAFRHAAEDLVDAVDDLSCVLLALNEPDAAQRVGDVSVLLLERSAQHFACDEAASRSSGSSSSSSSSGGGGSGGGGGPTRNPDCHGCCRHDAPACRAHAPELAFTLEISDRARCLRSLALLSLLAGRVFMSAAQFLADLAPRLVAALTRCRLPRASPARQALAALVSVVDAGAELGSAQWHQLWTMAVGVAGSVDAACDKHAAGLLTRAAEQLHADDVETALHDLVALTEIALPQREALAVGRAVCRVWQVFLVRSPWATRLRFAALARFFALPHVRDEMVRALVRALAPLASHMPELLTTSSLRDAVRPPVSVPHAALAVGAAGDSNSKRARLSVERSRDRRDALSQVAAVADVLYPIAHKLLSLSCADPLPELAPQAHERASLACLALQTMLTLQRRARGGNGAAPPQALVTAHRELTTRLLESLDQWASVALSANVPREDAVVAAAAVFDAFEAVLQHEPELMLSNLSLLVTRWLLRPWTHDERLSASATLRQRSLELLARLPQYLLKENLDALKQALDGASEPEVQLAAARVAPRFLACMPANVRLQGIRSVLALLAGISPRASPPLREAVAGAVGFLACLSAQHNESRQLLVPRDLPADDAIWCPLCSDASAAQPQPPSQQLPQPSGERRRVAAPSVVPPETGELLLQGLLVDADASVRCRAASSLFRLVRHLDPQVLVANQQERSTLALAPRVLRLVFDCDAEVRRLACAGIARLAASDAERLRCLFSSVPGKQAPDDMDMIKALATGFKVQHASALSVAPAAAALAPSAPPASPEDCVMACLAALGAAMRGDAQRALLERLVDRMTCSSAQVRALAFGHIGRMARAVGLPTKEFVLAQSNALVNVIVSKAAVRSAEVLEEVCLALVDMSLREFLRLQLPVALGELVVQCDADVLKSVAWLSVDDGNVQTLVRAHLHHVLAKVLTEVPWQEVERVLTFLITAIFPNFSLKELVNLCVDRLVLLLITRLASSEHRSVALLALRIVMATQRDRLSATATSSGRRGAPLTVGRRSSASSARRAGAEARAAAAEEEGRELLASSGGNGAREAAEALSQGCQNLVASDDDMAEFLHNEVLRLFDKLNNQILDQHKPLAQRREALATINQLIPLVSPRLHHFFFKITATLKSALRIEPLVESACEAWRSLAASLATEQLKQNLATLVLTVLPFADSCAHAADTLRYLLVERHDLRQELRALPPLPPIARLDAAFEAVRAEMAQGMTPLERLQRLEALLRQESASIRLWALRQLKVALYEQRSELHRGLLRDSEGHFQALARNLVAALLRQCGEVDENLLLACSECIGELGALDPWALREQALAEPRVAAPERSKRERDPAMLAHHLISTKLVNAIYRDDDARAQDRALFAIQELLKVCGCDPSTPAQFERVFAFEAGSARDAAIAQLSSKDQRAVYFWNLFQPSLRDVIQPYLGSQYTLPPAPPKKRSLSAELLQAEPAAPSPPPPQQQQQQQQQPQPQPQPPPPPQQQQQQAQQTPLFFTEGINLLRWLGSWTRFLVERVRGPLAPVLTPCRGVLKTDVEAATFLLPYLVDSTLRYGSDEDLAQVQREIIVVLSSQVVGGSSSSSSSSSSGGGGGVSKGSASAKQAQPIVQLIFELIDVLNQWFAAEQDEQEGKNVTSDAAPASSRTSSASSAVFAAARGDKQRPLHEMREVLDAIPRRLLANASLQCKAHTRALRYVEASMREERRRARELSLRELPPPEVHRMKPEKEGAPPPPPFEFCKVTKLYVPHPLAESSMVSSPQDVLALQNVYADMDEPDGMSGISKLLSSTSLEVLTREYESSGKWGDALVCYERALADDPHSVAHHSGLLNALKKLGHFRTALAHVQGVAAAAPALAPAIAHHGVEAAWRLGQWSQVRELLEFKPDPGFEVGVGRVLCAMHDGSLNEVQIQLRRARLDIMPSLAAAARDSYRRAYRFVVQLHALREMEDFGGLLNGQVRLPLRAWGAAAGGGAGAAAAAAAAAAAPNPSLSAAERLLMMRRLRRTEASFAVRAPILSLRQVMLSGLGMQRDAAQSWLLLAKEARTAGQFEFAAGTLLQVTGSSALMARVESAKLLRSKGQMREALRVLDEVLRELASPEARARVAAAVADQQETGEVAALNSKARVLMGRWLMESKQSKDVAEWFRGARTGWAKAHFHLARFYDTVLLSILHSSEEQANALSSGSGVAASAGTAAAASSSSASTKKAEIDAVKNLFRSYMISLKQSNKYLFQALPRVLTLYFDLCDRERARAPRELRSASAGSGGGSVATTRPRSNRVEELMAIARVAMADCIKHVVPYQWLTVLPQLMSRLCDQHGAIRDLLKAVVPLVFRDYSQQAVWMVVPLSHFSSAKQERANELLAVVQESHPSTRPLLRAAHQLFTQLIQLCNYSHEPKDKTDTKLKLSARLPALYNLSPAGIIVPRLSALTISLPADKDGEVDEDLAAGIAAAVGVPGGRGGGGNAGGGGGSSSSSSSSSAAQFDRVRSWRPFPSNLPTITGFEDTVKVITSKEQPKRLGVCGSDGRTHYFLCKKENAGDMRKAARMMEFCSMVNRLLNKNAETRQRKLSMITFAALPLTEECGIIEWVNDTMPLRGVLLSQYDEVGVRADMKTIKQIYINAKRIPRVHEDAIELAFYYRMLERFEPVLHRWFLSRFQEPTQWFESRLRFTRSTAVWSMVGYVLGLGDRHLENILLRTVDGECVHVDFDCLFNRGAALEKPERVPFRLTQNIVDGFGITSYNGVFRRSCEVVLKTLRDNREMLMTAMHAFLHDPLANWCALGGNVHEAIRLVEQRLNGYVDLMHYSVEGQVDAVIKEAVEDRNLSRMFLGWTPFW